MTGFRRRTDALVHTVLVNAGLVPIPSNRRLTPLWDRYDMRLHRINRSYPYSILL